MIIFNKRKKQLKQRIITSFMIMASTFILASCSDKSVNEDAGAQEVSSISESSPEGSMAVQSPLNQRALNQANSNQTTTPQVIPPVVIQSPTYFAPNASDIKDIFVASLSQTISQIPESTEKNAWIQKELAKLNTLQVYSCTQSPIGTPSICRIVFNGKVADIKVLYTQKGWELLR